MKIVIPTIGLNVSGGARYICEVANRLIKRGHEVSIIIPRNGRVHFPTSAEIIKGDYVFLKPYFDTIVSLFKMYRCIPKCDIILANYNFTAYPAFLAKLAKKGRVVYLVQSYETIFMNNLIRKMSANFSYHLPFHYISNSDFIARILKDKFSKGSTVIHPGINHEVFKSYPSKNKGEKRVLTIGSRIIGIKGFDDFIDAIKIVNENLKNVEFVVGTQGGIEESHLYNIVVPRNDLELAQLYSSCSVFVSTSWFEGFCLPPLEAMACGVPVVVTDSGGINDYAVNGKNAIIVPPRNPMAIAEGIIKVLSDRELSNHLIENGIKTASFFSWEKTTNMVEEMFHRIYKKN